MTLPEYTDKIPTVAGWYFSKPESAYTGYPVYVCHDDGAYGTDKSAPLCIGYPCAAGRKSPAELGGLWSGPIFDPDEDMDQLVEVHLPQPHSNQVEPRG